MSSALRTASRILNSGLWVICLTIAFAIVPIIGADWEGRAFPVLTNVKMKAVPSMDPNRVAFDVTGTKARACKFIEVRALILAESVWVKGDFAFQNPGDTSTSRPLGTQSFGVWSIKPPGSVAKFEAVHECHFGWNTVTALGTWEVR